MSAEKVAEKIAAMTTGGKNLREVKLAVVAAIKPGVTFAELEAIAQKEIKARGAKPNFSMVPGYHWATCIMKNDAVCHGIPTQEQVVEDGDIITVDVGLLYDGYHVDTSITVPVGKVSSKIKHFLDVGRASVKNSIQVAKVGSSVYDLSMRMQKTVEKDGFGAVYQLTGHGIGKKLHEEPSIPCVADQMDRRHILKEGQTIAIEIMYTMGDPELTVDADGWTYRTKDGSLSGMFEETVLVTKQGPVVLT